MSNINWASCPEATHFDPVDQNFLREVGEVLLLFNIKRGWTSPLHTVYGLRIEDCNRPLIKRPGWNGEGLPPVGLEIECTFDHWGYWLKGKVLCYGQKMIFMEQESSKGEGKFEGSMIPDGIKFRPIRTPEQIASEEREKAEDEMYGLTETSCNPEVVRAQRAVCAALYAAGYRKQEAP